VTEELGPRIEGAWRRSDLLFSLVAETALYERPIRLRQPLIFYLGHLPAFAWNQVGAGALGRARFRADFDRLFERGIDPPDTGDGPDDRLAWPQVGEVRAYGERVRSELRPVLDDVRLRSTLLMLLEHELMHHETLLYMLIRLPHSTKRAPRGLPPLVFDGAAPRQRVRIPEGRVELGAERGSLPFGWDNEFPACVESVPAFTIDSTAVRNRDFLEFVTAGGYEQRKLWSEEAWEWKLRRDHHVPSFWNATPDGWTCRTLFADVSLEQALDWPVYTTWAEASAFALFLGRRLPTEAEFHRAAYTTPAGERRLHPWGDEEPRAEDANVGFRAWAPRPVGGSPCGASAWGVLDLVGNGWDWTSTPFAPFPGFEPMPTYRGYSADFFDGRHFVMLGGSFATDDALLRRSFRNWYQPLYPYVFAQFRCVSSD